MHAGPQSFGHCLRQVGRVDPDTKHRCMPLSQQRRAHWHTSLMWADVGTFLALCANMSVLFDSVGKHEAGRG